MSHRLHIRIREQLRSLRRRLARPTELALRRELAADRAALEQRLAATERACADLAGQRDRLADRLHQLDGRLGQLDALVATAAEGLLPPRPEPPREATPTAPRVSVILPTRDRAALVVDAVRSVQAQRLSDWELLIVDDASADGTAEALAPFLADRRVRVLRNATARGEAGARNRALREARGELVAYVDSDNLLFPGFLAQAVEAFARDPGLECAYGAVVADVPCFGGSRILWRPFDRRALLQGNFIDVGAFVHRRRLFLERGGFDESLPRMTDWDLILRYTSDRDARPLPVLSTYYRTVATDRATDLADAGANWFAIQRKWLPRPAPGRGPRVLWLQPEPEPLRDRYLETERRALERLGARIEVLPARGSGGAALEAALRDLRPDVLHACGTAGLPGIAGAIARAGVPVTVRALGAEPADELRSLADLPGLRRLFVLPHQREATGDAARCCEVPAVFDTALFRPGREREPGLVTLDGAGRPATVLAGFLELATLLPGHDLLLLAGSRTPDERAELERLAAALGSPARIAWGSTREEVAAAVARAEVVVCPDDGGGEAAALAPAVEAMATGALLLVPERAPGAQELAAADAALLYGDLREAAERVRAAHALDPARRRRARIRAIDHAFFRHADETSLLPVLQEWQAAAAAAAAPAREEAAA